MTVIDWAWQGRFHHTTDLYSLEVDGVNINVSNQLGFDIDYNHTLNFSILLPARNVSMQTWNCDLTTLCYNGGLNFATNGSEDSEISEHYIWIENSNTLHYMTEYKFQFNTTQQTSFKLLSLSYISGFNHTIYLNSSIEELLTENLDSTSTLPVKISTERGGIIFDGEIIHEKSIVDSWISLPQQTFRPGLIQTAISQHEILAGAPDLDSITLSISASQNLADTIAIVTVDNLDTGARFIFRIQEQES